MSDHNSAPVDGTAHGQPGDSTAAAQRAFDRIAALGDVERKRIYDPQLNAELEPLRRLPALEVICFANGCGRRLAWWAIDQGHAYIAATEHRSKPKQRRGGMADIAKP